MKQYIMVEPTTKKLTVYGYVSSSVEGEVKAWLENEGVMIADDVKRLLPSLNSSFRDYARVWSWIFGLGGIALCIYVFLQNRRNRRKKSA